MAAHAAEPLLLRDVGLTLRGHLLLDAVSLTVRAGEVVALLGRNGAGKSTLLHAVAHLRHHTAGEILVAGAPPGSAQARTAMTVVLQDVDFPVTVRVGELLTHIARHYPQPRDPRQVADLLGLADCWQRQAGGLSGGEERKVALACALLGSPRLIVLDEPTAGLDRTTCAQLWTALGEFACSGGAVLFTTHVLAEVEQHAQRAVLLDMGRVVADEVPAALAARLGLSRIAFVIAGDAEGLRPPVLQQLSRAPGHVRSIQDGERWVLLTREPDDAIAWLVRTDLPMRGISIEPLGLGAAVDELLAQAHR